MTISWPWRRTIIFATFIVFALALEGLYFAAWPFTLIHLLYLPVLYGPPRWVLAGLSLLALLEFGLTNIPFGAAFSLSFSLYLIYRLIRHRINVNNRWLAGIFMIGIEFLRFIWINLFLALYRVPATTGFLFWHTLIEALLGIVVLQLFLKHNQYFLSIHDMKL